MVESTKCQHIQKMTFIISEVEGEGTLYEEHYRIIVLVNKVSKIHCGNGWEFLVDGVCVDFCLNTFTVDIYYHFSSDDKRLFEIYNEIKVGKYICISGTSFCLDDDFNGLCFYHPSFVVIPSTEIPDKVRRRMIDNLIEGELQYLRVNHFGEEHVVKYGKDELFNE